MMRAYLHSLAAEVRAHWPAYLLLGAVWCLAVDRVFYHHAPHLPLLFNVTPSLPYKVAFADYTSTAFKRGDYVIYAFHGEAKDLFPGLKGQPFFKVIRGVPGDRVSVRDRRVYINDVEVGIAKSFGPKHLMLDPIAPTVIPPGHFYMQGTSDGSFDSRYQLGGLVNSSQIVAVVHPLL